MPNFPYLNLGCGSTFHKDWTNVDFVSNSSDVIGYNLLNGIPFDKERFEVVYHSHVLEHFSKNDAHQFLNECHRVLKSNGIIRIAIPNLETIVYNYTRIIDKFKKGDFSEYEWANYEWTVIEMIDQIARHSGGGNMAKFLRQETILNKDFILSRCGGEINNFWRNDEDLSPKSIRKNKLKTIINTIGRIIFGRHYNYYMTGRYRLTGEVHQWMYDKYSLTRLLETVGFQNVIVRTAFESGIKDWNIYQLESADGVVRKPDSLFIEAIKL